MAKVTVELGATIPTQDYGNLKPVVRISDIDLEGDVDKQLADALAVSIRIYKALDDELELLVNDTVAGEAKPSARETLMALVKQVKLITETLRGQKMLPPKEVQPTEKDFREVEKRLAPKKRKGE